MLNPYIFIEETKISHAASATFEMTIKEALSNARVISTSGRDLCFELKSYNKNIDFSLRYALFEMTR